MKIIYLIKFYYFSIVRFLIFLPISQYWFILPTLLNNIYNIGEGISGVLFLPITVSVILGSMFYKRISKEA